MKAVKHGTYSRLRSEYTNAYEMAEVIFKTPSYIYQRMNGKRSFTHREKVALLKAIGRSEEDIPAFFPEV